MESDEIDGLSLARKTIVVLMGASGAGKTTLGQALAHQSRSHIFIDADDYHPPSNRQKMASGIALTDADRQVWLQHLTYMIQNWVQGSPWDCASDWAPASTRDSICDSTRGVDQADVMYLACSALKQAYRDRLRSAVGPGFIKPDALNGSLKFGSLRFDSSKLDSKADHHADGSLPLGAQIRFVWLKVDQAVLELRVNQRARDENHFMPASLVLSQLQTLEPPAHEADVCVLDGAMPLKALVSEVRSWLFKHE